jgi:large conductance mechanosensitive channel
VCCNALGIGGSPADRQRGNPDVLKEFKDFINKGDVVTIAVGLVMALFFKAIIDRVVGNIIMPLVAAIVGEPNLASIGIWIRGDGEVLGVNEDGTVATSGDGTFLSIGQVLNAVIVFLAVAFVLFLVVKAYNKYVAKPVEEEAAPTEVELLTQIRDSLANR